MWPREFYTPWEDRPEVAGLKMRERWRQVGSYWERTFEWMHPDGSVHPENWTPYAGVPRIESELIIAA